MPNSPQRWTLDDLESTDLGAAVVIASPSVARRTRALALPSHPGECFPTENLDTVVVVGGGTLIDRYKAWRAEHAPQARLVAIPSIWGSGAECSPFAVLEDSGRKQILDDEAILPDVVIYWPELAETLPDELARDACGDTWAHALEGFLSPLATESLREELATVIRTLLDLPIGNDPRWFEPSGRACALQSRSSVGLVHGIAHTLEGPLKQRFPGQGWGHAKLCATFLGPVMHFNRQAGDKWSRTLAAHDLTEAAILEKLWELFDEAAYDQAVEQLEASWRDVLRDPCTRTNSTTVRPASLAYFTGKSFQ